MDASTISARDKDKLVGQKRPFKLKEIWAIGTRLQLSRRTRNLSLFNLGIDSLRPGQAAGARRGQWRQAGSPRAKVIQQKTGRPVQFELTEPTRVAVSGWIRSAHLRPEDFLFPSRVRASPHLGTRQYARIVDGWVEEIGLESPNYGTHSMRRTKASLAYRRTKNLRSVQLLLGHTKLDYLPRR